MNTIDSFKGEFFFLSNFYKCKIRYKNIEYPSVEHAFQAAKTFDLEEKLKILDAETPDRAKYLGRRVKLREDWELVKLDVMKELLKIKFSDSRLKNKLLATGNAILIEGNTWNDRYWGVCKGVGENNLGKLLMEIRTSYQIFKIPTKRIILHQVNCKGVMGGGFALYVRQMFPECYNQYKEVCWQNSYSKNLLGHVYVYENDRYIILNMFSQYDYGYGDIYTDYKAMENALKTIRAKYPKEVITCPKYIGCGLAGGDWSIVEPLLEKYNIATSENIVF